MGKVLLSLQATSTNQIHELEKQVASITTELYHTHQQNVTLAPNKPTSNNPKRGRSSLRTPTQYAYTPATPHPHKPATDDLTLAACIAAAAKHKEKLFTTITYKQKKPVLPTIIPKSLPYIE
jgi:hypothetical protein